MARRLLATAVALGLAVGLTSCSDDTGAVQDQDQDQGGRSSNENENENDGNSDEVGNSDEDDDGPEPLEPVELPASDEPYADALAATFGADGQVSAVQADCVASNVVGVIGSDRLDESGMTPEEFAADALASLGPQLGRDEAEEIYDAFAGCGYDYRAVLFDSIASSTEDPAAVRACLEQAVSDADVRNVVVATLLAGADGEADRTGDALYEAAEACDAAARGG